MIMRPYLTTAEDAVNRQAIRELVEFERYCRDNCLWAEMKSCWMTQSQSRANMPRHRLLVSW